MAQYIKDNGEWKKIGGVEKYPAEFGTRAEFEAKKDDLPVGTVFTTTDEFEEGEKDIYSTEEVKTNKVWVDGKPIYRRVVSFPSMDITPNDWNTINSLSIAGIDEIINARGKRSADNAIISVGVRSSGVSSIQVTASANFGISELILEYTKQ